MINNFTIVKNKGWFGLNKGADVILPCVYDAIWQHTETLLGFRDDATYGLFSMTEEKVIVSPILLGEFAYYKQYDAKSGKARFRSCYGIHSLDKIYIESVHHLIQEDGITPAQDEKGVVLIHDDGRLEWLTEEDEETLEYYSFKVVELSFVETSEGEIQPHRDGNMPFLSSEDEKQHESEQPFNQAVALVKFMKYVDQVIQEQGLEKYIPKDGIDQVKYREFDYAAIPDSTVQACENHLGNYYEVEPASAELTQNLIYLAWLYANDYVISIEPGLHTPDHRYEYESPEGECGINLVALHDLYDLHKIIPFLKVSGVVGAYLPILAFQN